MADLLFYMLPLLAVI